ncbi:hypothetical protein ABPG74_022241 [Tetrahymena malaccensis]
MQQIQEATSSKEELSPRHQEIKDDLQNMLNGSKLKNLALSIHINDDLVKQYLNILTEYMRYSEQQCENFVLADQIKSKILATKSLIEEREKEELKSLMLNQQINLELQHYNEFNKAVEYWQEKEDQFQQKQQFGILEIKERHIKDMEQYQEILDQFISQKPKDSSELLNLKKIQNFLAKKTDYKKAHQLQQMCQVLEQEEMKKWNQQREYKIQNFIQMLKQKQEQEVDALKRRLDNEYGRISLAKEEDFKRILIKYQGLNRDLESQQQSNLKKFDKLYYKRTTQNLKTQQDDEVSSIPYIPKCNTSMSNSRYKNSNYNAFNSQSNSQTNKSSSLQRRGFPIQQQNTVPARSSSQYKQ